MADVDVDPFGDHNKTKDHTDETGENTPLTPGGAVRGESTQESE